MSYSSADELLQLLLQLHYLPDELVAWHGIFLNCWHIYDVDDFS